MINRMKKITLVRRAIATPNSISYAIELEVIVAEDITKEIFVKQRLIKPDNKFEDVFVAVASPAQMEDLDIDCPAAESSYFRVKKITMIGSNSSFLEDVFRTILAEIQLLLDNEEALTLLESEAIYMISSDNVETSLVPVSLATSSGEYKSISLDTPTGHDNITMFYTTREILVKQLISIVGGSNSPSVSWSMRFAANRTASGTELKSGGFSTSDTQLGQVFTSFTNPIVPAGSYVWITTTSVTGNPTSLDITMVFQ